MGEMKKKISKNDKLALEGLKVLGDKCRDQLELLRSTVREIVGEDDEYGFSNDFIWCGDLAVDELLERLEITVKK
jgi:hypothetical protein